MKTLLKHTPYYVDGGYSKPALFDMIIFAEDTLYLLNDNYYPGSGGGGISYDVALKIHASEISVINSKYSW